MSCLNTCLGLYWVFYTYIYDNSYLGRPPLSSISFLQIANLHITRFTIQSVSAASLVSARILAKTMILSTLRDLWPRQRLFPSITWPDSMRKIGRPADAVPSDRTQFPNWTLTLDLSLKNCLHHPGSPPPHPCVQIEDAPRRSAPILGVRSVFPRLTPRCLLLDRTEEMS